MEGFIGLTRSRITDGICSKSVALGRSEPQFELEGNDVTEVNSTKSEAVTEPGDPILYEVRDGIARITLNRPEQRNALSFTLLRQLREVFAVAKRDSAVRVVVLQGAGDAAFCAGMDLRDVGDGTSDFVSLHEDRGLFASLFTDLWEMGKPTIARVQGWALAGGFGLALSCDIVVASDRARFGAPEINVGLWPHMITVPLARAMPAKKVLELMMTGRIVGAEEGERLGFVSKLVAPDGLDAAVDEYAALFAQKSSSVMKLGRDAFYTVWDMPFVEALKYLHASLTLTASTNDAAEGISAFLEKRPPKWLDS